MADLTFIEKMKLEKLLEMGGGYVLDFSNRTLEEFVLQSVHKKIYDDAYNYASGSKANRIRAFWDREPNPVVGKLIADLLEYREFSRPNRDEESKRLYDDCRRIAERLSSSRAAVQVAATNTDPVPQRSSAWVRERAGGPLELQRPWRNAPSMNIAEVKGRVDFGILTIREDEFRAVLRRFPDKLGDGRAQGRRIYNLRSLALPGGGAYTLAISRCVEQGNGEALAMARDLLEDLAPRWLLVVGIAGGMPSSEITLGDIVVSTRILDFSVEAVLEGGAFEHAITGGPVHHAAAALAANLPALDDELGAWNSPESIGTPRPPVDFAPGNFYGDEAWQKNVRESLKLHFGGTPRPPRFTAGALASSDRLVKDTGRTKPWLLAARQIVAVEMESGGVHRATNGRDVPFLAIRGLSDVVGFKRDEAWTRYACETAAVFAQALLLTRPIAVRQEAPPYEIRVHDSPRSDRRHAIEVRPCAGVWSPFFFAIPIAEQEAVSPMVFTGVQGRPPAAGALHGTSEEPSLDGKWWLRYAEDAATPLMSYYLLCNHFPTKIAFGVLNGKPQYEVGLDVRGRIAEIGASEVAPPRDEERAPDE
ncbi:5'-methylthioadenosine/S-adenosylhomocysteine nucleosidase [Polyangium sorediatum]|uniref:Nucleoside phosphorylase domain-containing protein n=1 Tax=Polyangium sorediatum TaxID=889274 RepID=A0ABT6PA53_9BACT|nr:5'-methylthioadenosine/S-adenosylhomocysteine nucleosidase [Polyangium sorediatum]MDI1437511.1 hypothetical protein [Polyangium sorediatum]